MSLKTIKTFTFDKNKKLGEGSTGIVYLGTDSRTKQPIAVKAIDMNNINNEVTQYLLKNEMKALQLTNHPNVLRAIDIIQEPDFVYIVTEYLPNGTLAEFIQKMGSIPEGQAIEIFKQIVEGYDHIFDLNIYHRDLKPHNILFDFNFRPVLSDFGYCEITGFLPPPSIKYNVGSPGFMAPESIVSNMYSENSQVWSLGAILYEMMTGKNYTNGKPVMQAVMLIKTQGPYYPDNASPFTKSIIKQCMMLKPEIRMKVKTLKQLLQENSKPKINYRHSIPNHNIFKASIISPPKQMNHQFVNNVQNMNSPQKNGHNHLSAPQNIPITSSPNIESISPFSLNLRGANTLMNSNQINLDQAANNKLPITIPPLLFGNNAPQISPKSARRGSIIEFNKPQQPFMKLMQPLIQKPHTQRYNRANVLSGTKEQNTSRPMRQLDLIQPLPQYVRQPFPTPVQSNIESSFSELQSAPFYMPNMNDFANEQDNVVRPYNTLTNGNGFTHSKPKQVQVLQIISKLSPQHRIQQQIIHGERGISDILANNIPVITQGHAGKAISPIKPIKSAFGNLSVSGSLNEPLIMHPVPVFDTNYVNVIMPKYHRY